MRSYRCNYCSHLYIESEGDEDSGLPPGTLWAHVPDDWYCPDCGRPKSDFELVEE